MLKGLCIKCGKEYYYYPSVKNRRYCSLKCFYRTPKVKKQLSRVKEICKKCGQPFLRYPSAKNRVYCSTKCYYTVRRTGRTLYTFNCIVCGNSFKTYDKLVKTCSSICRSKLISKSNNYKFKTKSGDYILLRDTFNKKYKLEHRVIMEKKIGRILKRFEMVHHKNGIKTDNRLENLEIVVAKTHFGIVNCPYCLREFKIK